MVTTLILFLLILGLLVFVHEFGHFWAAKKNGVTVHEFAFGFKPRLFSWKRGTTEYAINALPFGGYVRLEGEDGSPAKKGSFAAKPVGVRAKVLIAGVAMNIVLAWIALTLAYMVGSTPLSSTFATRPLVAVASNVILGKILPDTPASIAGLKKGDQIVSVDGATVESAEGLIQLTKSKAGQTIVIELKRGDTIQRESMTPRQNPPPGQGPLGITLIEASIARTPWYGAPLAGLSETGSQIKSTFVGLGKVGRDLFFGRVSEDVSGLVGVGVATGVVRRLGIGSVLQFISLISVNLALINLVPIPPLDGGHLLFLGLEAWRKKSFDAVKGYVTMGGLVALILFAVVVTYKDILRFDIVGRLTDFF